MIPIYSVLRRLTTVITLAGEIYLLSRQIPFDEQASVIMMVFGAFIAGWGDLEFHLWGYMLIGLNCVATAGYLVTIKQVRSSELPTLENAHEW
jgi:drug/metabolite transporter (DMT)-like permease